jgi:hypothetical protein
MWHWDQGRLAYFQFDTIRTLARAAKRHDFRNASRSDLEQATGFPFLPAKYTPWRNYSRVLKLCLLISEINGEAKPTAVAEVLSKPGAVTCDEYLHFIATATTEPSPALQDWKPDAEFRFPLLVALKYLLAKAAIPENAFATLDELVGMYVKKGFDGSEDVSDYLMAVQEAATFPAVAEAFEDKHIRQAKESLKVLCQISYLSLQRDTVYVNLDPADALDVFADLHPIGGPRAATGSAEIRRLADLFAGGSVHDFFTYPNTVINDVVESGFKEGSKVEKTHITIERNGGLRKAYFAANPTAFCDVCTLDTHATYPWTERVMDLHHLLPLCSGTRVVGHNTTFDDLVPLCPSCHRAVHRYYGVWLAQNAQPDFQNRDEAVGVYAQMKQQFMGLVHA